MNQTTLKPSQIQVQEDFNPRTDFDKKKLAELAASIKQEGIIQPLIVGEADEKGKHPLIAGHRRYAAANLLKLKTLPVVMRSVNGNAKAIAVIENLQREDLNPIDEANGFAQVMEVEGLNQKKLAERLGISTSQVSDRLKLLKLPEGVQEGIAGGKVAPVAAPLLEKIAKVSPNAAVIAATLIASGEYDASRLVSEPSHLGNMLGRMTAAIGQDFPCWVNLGNFHRLNAGIWTEDDPEIAQLVDAAGSARSDYSGNARPDWTDDDIDAARSFGCLFEIRIGHHGYVYAADRDFVIDRLKLKLAKYEEAKAKQAQAKAKNTEYEDDEKARRAQEREKARVNRIEANDFNVELGRNMSEHLQALNVTLERLRVLCLMIANGDTGLAAGRVLTDENQSDFEQKFRKSDGAEQIKITPIPRASAHELLMNDIVEAESPEALMGIMFETFIAQHCGRFDALSGNDPYNYHSRLDHSRYDAPPTHDPTIEISRVALSVVPATAAKEIAERLKAYDQAVGENDAEAATEAAEDLADVATPNGAPLAENPAITDADRQLDIDQVREAAEIDGGGSDIAAGGSDDAH